MKTIKLPLILPIIILLLLASTACSNFENNQYINYATKIDANSNRYYIIMEDIEIPIDSLTNHSYPVYHNACPKNGKLTLGVDLNTYLVVFPKTICIIKGFYT